MRTEKASSYSEEVSSVRIKAVVWVVLGLQPRSGGIPVDGGTEDFGHRHKWACYASAQ